MIRLRGGDLCYVEGGRRGQSATLLLHGGYGGWVHWIANIDSLAAHRHVLAVDMPGFGHSYDPGRCLEPIEQARVAAEFLERLGVNHVTVAGFSFGSVVATMLAIDRPDLVRSVLLINPPGVGVRSAEALAIPARMSAVARAHGRRAGIASNLRELMLCHGELIDTALVDLVSDSIARTRYVTRSVSQQAQTLQLLRRVTQKVKVLIGEQDPFHRNDLQGRVSAIDEALGEGTVHIVPDAAHWLQYDRPDAFNEALLEFTSTASETGS